MKESGLSALCCGNCAWTGCDSYSKALQVKRLQQAREAGGDLLVTACPKCQIHLRCAMQDPFRGKELEIEMKDLVSLVADTIRWE
jgi:Fe-S oxidoreductase